MPITINGTGSIAGIGAGGLPTGSVTSATLSSSAIYLTAPAGSICFVCQSAAPTGWIKANGAAVSRATYADLFAAIGITFGDGDGSTTFNLPDMRGEFPRGFDDSRGADTGRALGTAQAQDWKGFWMTNTGQNTTSYSHNDVYMGKSTAAYTGNLFAGSWAAPAAAIGAKWDTSETRPRNVALLAIIKF